MASLRTWTRATLARRAGLGLPLAACLATTVVFGGAEDEGDEIVAIEYGTIEPPVVGQWDITVREKTSIHPVDPEPQPLECSGLDWTGSRLILTSDRHGHVVFTLPLDLSGPDLEVPTPRPRVIVDTEKLLLMDAECVTVRRAPAPGSAYVLCSMSNDPDGGRRPKRQHFARIPLDGEGRLQLNGVVVLPCPSIRTMVDKHFKALHVQPYRSFFSEKGVNTVRWGSVEGMAWAPTGETLLCGMRNPLAGEEAIVFAVAGVDEAFDTRDASKLALTDLFRLDLGGRGVSDLAWDPITQGYLLTAALSNGPRLDANQVYPLEDLRSALFWWSGHKRDEPMAVASIRNLNVDGVCRIGRTPYIALGSDEGDVSEEREGRQSVLTIMAFTGIPRTGP